MVSDRAGDTRQPITIQGVNGQQDEIDTVAKRAGDRQWIHTYPEGARSGPFGTTVLTLMDGTAVR